MKSLMVVAAVLFCLCSAFAGEEAPRIYTNKDLEKYRTDAGGGVVDANSFRYTGYSKCYELDSMSESQLRGFLDELDSMRKHYTSKPLPAKEKRGVLKSIKSCREKVEARLKTMRRRDTQRAGILL